VAKFKGSEIVQFDEFIKKENFLCGLQAADKISVIEQLVKHVALTIPIKIEIITKLLINREKKKTSGYGNQIAIVHIISPLIQEMHVVFAILKNAIEWGATDDKKVQIAVAVFSPTRHLDDHLLLLGNIYRVFKDNEVKHALIEMKNEDQMENALKLIKKGKHV